MVPALVVFDCDGVLVDSEPISAAVLAGLITEAGMPLTPEEARRRYSGKRDADVDADVTHGTGRPVPTDFWERFERERDARFRSSLRPVPGAAETILAVQRAGCATCVASQSSPAKMALTLGLCGLRELFADDALFSADDVPRGKPWPDLFLAAAAHFGAAPDRCLVVEDSATGLRAARAAGMEAVAYVADGQPAPELDHAVTVIDALPELIELIELRGGPGPGAPRR